MTVARMKLADPGPVAVPSPVRAVIALPDPEAWKNSVRSSVMLVIELLPVTTVAMGISELVNAVVFTAIAHELEVSR